MTAPPDNDTAPGAGGADRTGLAGSADVGADRGSKSDIESGRRFAPLFDEAGLIPAIVSDTATGEVLMFAWMNAEALARSIETGEAVFYSRSRKRLWKKGEESGNVLRIREMRTDCDQDAILLRVSVAGDGVACHTGARSCFYRRVEGLGGSSREVALQRSDDGK